MKVKRLFRTSFFLALTYCILSCIYLFGGLFDPISDNGLRQTLETIIMFPATMIFVFAYGGGTNAAFLAAIISFIAIWGIAFLVVFVFKNMRGDAHSQ